MLIRKVAERILEKSRGDQAGGWGLWARDILEPKIDPRTKLLRHVRKAVELVAGQGDYSYRRPSRRNPRPDIVLPSAMQPFPRVSVIVDTSGSMDQRDLGLALGLVAKVLNTFRVRDGVRVVCGDTQAHTAGKVFRPQQVCLAGGGGTDMRRLIHQAVEERPKPQLIVVVTDGYTPWPAQSVGVPVVACLTRKTSGVPQWIETVVLET